MGSYVNKNLITGEKVIFETTHHWIIFFSFKSLFTLGIYPLIKRKTDEFAVTNRRVIVKTGWFNRKTLEMNLQKIETVHVDQSVFARLVGYGTLRITGTGGTNEVFPFINHPLEFRKKFEEASINSPSPANQNMPVTNVVNIPQQRSVVDELERLKNLLDGKYITEEEYKKLKEKIIS